MTDLKGWVDARRPAAPASLRTVILRALEVAGGSGAANAPGGDPAVGVEASAADRLADAGLATLRSVMAGDAGRSSAPTLLAADALLTYACEAASGEGPGAVVRLGERLSPAAFEALLGSGS